MTVRELISKLEQFDGDLKVLVPRYSDYTLEVEDPYIMEGIDKKGWVQTRFPYADGSIPEKVENFVVVGD